MFNTLSIKRNILYHLLFWCALFAAWYFFRYEDYSSKKLAFNITVLQVTDLAFMVYVTNYLLIPKLLYKKRYVLFGFVFLLFIVGSSWLKMYIEGQLVHHPELFNVFRNFKRLFYDNTIPHLLLVSTGAGFKLILDYAKAQKRMGEMAKENAEAELNFLKSQINPHFVFNSLNAVYFLINKENAEARDALHKFSGMLRYQLYECNGHKTSIEKELDYIKNYIDLQRLRTGERCEISFICSPSVQGFSIEPLLLIPFVENAFKHLSFFNDKKNEVHISIGKNDSSFLFDIENTADNINQEPLSREGIGLKNVKRRLELLYPGKHELVIQNSPGNFLVSLKLAIDREQ